MFFELAAIKKLMKSELRLEYFAMPRPNGVHAVEFQIVFCLRDNDALDRI